MQRIKNLSHNDLDGGVAAICVATAHAEDHVSTEFLDVNRIYMAVKHACEARVPWDRIVLSDISITKKLKYKDDYQKELVESLPGIVKNYVDNGGEFVIVDHHDTAMAMKIEYNGLLHPDSLLTIHGTDGELISGSELAAIYMANVVKNADKGLDDETDNEIVIAELFPSPDEAEVDFMVIEYYLSTFIERLTELAKIAGDLDVWRDPFGFGGRLGLALDLMDDMHTAYGELYQLCCNASALELEFEELMESVPILNYYYEMASNKLEGAINYTNKTLIEYHPLLHKFDNKFFPSHCADHIYRKTKGITMNTYTAGYSNSRRISFRTHPGVGIHLGNFCKEYGGAGHALSAGMTLPNDMTIEELADLMIAKIDSREK